MQGFLKSLVIVGNFNFGRSVIRSNEANSELIVDPNTIVPLPVSLECFKSIPWRDFQFIQQESDILQ